jgi:hypothetical protein
MLRPLRFAKPAPASDSSTVALTSPDVPEGATAYVVSVARRYQSRGLSLAQLVAAGEGGLQRARRHFGEATELFDRWGHWWVKESILLALHEDDQASIAPR